MFFNLPMADSFTTPRSLHCAQQDSTNHPASKDNVLAGHWHYSPATRCISDLLLGGKIQQESLIFLSCASRKMDFSKVTIVVAFFVIHRKMHPVISILSLLVTATIQCEVAPHWE